MALLWIEGFDAFGITTAPDPTGVVGRKYPSVANESMFSIGAGRFGGYAMQILSVETANFFSPALTIVDTVVLGCSVKLSANVPNDVPFISLYDGATRGMNLVITTAGYIVAKRGTTVLATSAYVIALGVWHYIEFKVKCHSTAGTYEAVLDGTTIIKDAGGTVNTQAGSNAYHDRFKLSGQHTATAQTFWFDDLYFLDSTGAANNDFLGIRKVTTLFPSGAGTANAWTGSAVADHYTLVDEQLCDDDTTYIESSTSAQKELWGYSDISDVGAISGLQVCTDCRETDASAFSVITVVSTASESDDAGQAIGTSSYVTRRRLCESDPHDSAVWDATRISTAQFGVKVP